MLEYIVTNFSPVLKILLFALFFLIVVAVVLYKFQDKLIYIPVIQPLGLRNEDNPPGYRSPSEYRLNFQNIEIKTEDGVMIRGWKVLRDFNSDSSPTIVFFHENAGNTGTRLPFIREVVKRLKANFVIVAYRGYTNSDGVPSEQGLMYDGHAVMDYVTSQSDLDQSQIFVLGRSLGGAVAIYSLTSRKYKIAGLIQENTFTSIPAMVDKIMPAVAFLKKLVLLNNWPNEQRIGIIDVPTLFVMAEKDEIVPTEMMEKLYILSNSNHKEKYLIKNATHNGSWMLEPDNYFDKLQGFIDSVLRLQAK